jgi:hypothetical protein
MNTEDSHDACLNSLMTSGIATTKDVLTANRCVFEGVRRGFVSTIETATHELPRAYVICWEKTKVDVNENNVVELRPGHVPLRRSEPTVQDSTAATSTEPAAGGATSVNTMPPRSAVQPVPVEMARSSRFPRALAGFAAGALAAALCTTALGIHGWLNFFFGLTLPLIGAALGALTWRDIL